VISRTQEPVLGSTQQSQKTDVQAPERFEPAIPASERPQTNHLDSAAAVIGLLIAYPLLLQLLSKC
jgi:hypothetical protein